MRGGRISPHHAAARAAVLLVILGGNFTGRADAQSTSTPLPANDPPAPESSAPSKPAAAPAPVPTSTAQMAAALTRLTQSNQDLLDLLKKQQAVLEDIQYDRRLQNRQISSLEERLQEALQENAQLQAKVAKLEEQLSLGPSAAAASSSDHGDMAKSPTPAAKTEQATEPPPAPAESYLPRPESEGMPGTKSWHRLFTLSGADSRDSDYFHVQGRQWRVLWHNQDRPGASYVNTSALFISAFPKGDTIPQKVCSKLGSGGDSTELTGPGDFYLKVEASGGNWELAVEDFR